MQTGILKKIDLLVEMTESTTSADTLKAELKEVSAEIGELKEELIVLRESREGDKYFKVSEKQVDENIKVSLEAKIIKQEKLIRKLQKEIDFVVVEEEELHNERIKLQGEISLSERYVAELEKRLETIYDFGTREYYDRVLKSEKEKVVLLVSSLESYENRIKDTLEHLNYLNKAMEEMQDKLENEKTRLVETKANLGNQASYIDEELKENDERRIQALQKKISELEKRKLEIITDPSIIAGEAKELIIANDKVNALLKLQELVTIVKSKPYMDIPSSNELTTMLEEEEEAATTARDEFASLIDTKNYSSGDTEVVEERINYLSAEIASLEEKIKSAKAEIDVIDNQKFKNLVKHLENTNDTYKQLQDELEEYKTIIENETEEKTPKRRAILAAAYERKKKEIEDVGRIIDQYKENQKTLVEKAYILENDGIKNYEIEIDKHRQEIREMEFLLENVSEAKDVLAIENDKQKLKDLDAAVKHIKHRQKYAQTPSEIYDEIEISLGTMPGSNHKKEETVVPSKEEVVVTHFNDTHEEEDIVMKELPTLDLEEIEENENVESLETEIDENDFVIGEYEEEKEESK